MKINSINNVNFEKRRVAKAKIGQKDNPKKVKIFLMDKAEDYYELFDKLNMPDWKSGCYETAFLHSFACEYVTESFPKSDFFVMENNKGEIVTFANITHNCTKKSRDAYLNLLETSPAFKTFSQGERKYRYAGETMIAFLVNLAKKYKEKYIELTYDDDAKDFYRKHCNFDVDEVNGTAKLSQDSYDKILKSNAKHINNSLRILV